VISLAIGAVLTLWPEGSLRLLLTAFGLWVLVIGVSQTVAALQLPRGESGSPRPFGPRDDDLIRRSLATATPVSFQTSAVRDGFPSWRASSTLPMIRQTS